MLECVSVHKNGKKRDWITEKFGRLRGAYKKKKTIEKEHNKSWGCIWKKKKGWGEWVNNAEICLRVKEGRGCTVDIIKCVNAYERKIGKKKVTFMILSNTSKYQNSIKQLVNLWNKRVLYGSFLHVGKKCYFRNIHFYP